MAKFCGKCGTRLDEKTGKCPNCDMESSEHKSVHFSQDKDNQSEKRLRKPRNNNKKSAENNKENNNSADKKNKRSPKKFLIILILFFCVLVITRLFIYFGIIDIPPVMEAILQDYDILPQEKELEEFNHLEGKYTEIEILDEESAILAAADALNQLGLDSVAEELTVNSITTSDGYTYYRLQQRYQGIPVYGRTVVVIAKEDGEAAAFSSNAIEVEDKIDDINYLNQEEIMDNIKEYLINNGTAKDEASVRINDLSNENLFIYPYQDTAQYIYKVQVYLNNSPLSFNSLLVNANTGEVIAEETSVYEDSSVECYDIEKKTVVRGNYDDIEKIYQLYDAEKGIKIYSYNKTNSKGENSENLLITSDNNVFGDSNEEKRLEAEKGVRLLYNAGKVRDYYSDYCNNTGYDLNYFYYNDMYDSGENALGGNVETDTGEVVGYLSMGSGTGVEKIDTLAHEYTHIITRKNVEWIDIDTSTGATDEPGAINEAYSDIFGELIEAYINSKSPDWIHFNRNMIDPMSNGYPAAIGDKSYSQYTTTDGTTGWYMLTTGNSLTDYSHGFSTIISHCAYLMSTGVNGNFTELTNDELRSLWYNTMLTLPSNCTFVVLRENMEMTAEFLGFGTSKMNCIKGAFDRVGIASQNEEETINTETTLMVYDRNGDLYGNYDILITGKEYSGWFKWGWIKSDYEKEIEVTTPDEISISLPKGDYAIDITDRADSTLHINKTVKVRPDSENDRIIMTSQFGRSNTVTVVNDEEVSIPADAVEFNGHYYYLYTGGIASTYEEALQFCADKGGYLATLTSQEENDFVHSYITRQNYGSAYFGFSDSESEGTWKWCTGEPVSYTNWHSGEPNGDNSNEDYGMLYEAYSDGSWNDGDFGNNTVNGGTAFICEWGDYQQNTGSQTPGRTTSDERDIVLVLDRSGSMEGTPIQETIKASTDFIDTILEEDASIGVVTYDSSAERNADFSMDKSFLTQTVSEISSGGGTNMESGLQEAQQMLANSNAKKKIIVLMSDGMPNDGKQGEELIAYADEIKDSGTSIYTLGFFENMGSDKSSAQYLMEELASDGCHYEVASADDLVFFFGDIADQINGQKYIYVRIACPVDVSVTYEGETLNSSDEDLNVRTDFGTLTFEESESEQSESEEKDDRIKVLRLKEGADYDLEIVGTGYGTMNYTIGFMDDDGNYDDFRRFENIRITKRTKIDTVAEVSSESILNIDDDGDGKYDTRLRAEENGYGEEVKTPEWVIFALGGAGILIFIDISIFIVLRIRKRAKRGRE